jgi:hypothetical protein
LPLPVRHFVETSFFGQITNKILNGLLAGVQKWRRAVTFSEQNRTMRTFTYRVYFTVSPTTYYVVGASNAKAAVWRARRLQRALRLNKRRTAPLKVAKVERLYRHGAGVRRVHS